MNEKIMKPEYEKPVVKMSLCMLEGNIATVSTPTQPGGSTEEGWTDNNTGGDFELGI